MKVHHSTTITLALSTMLIFVQALAEQVATSPPRKSHLWLSTTGVNVEQSSDKKQAENPKGAKKYPIVSPHPDFPQRSGQSFFSGSMMKLNVSLETSDANWSNCWEEHAYETWPEGLTISAGRLNGQDEFIPSQELTDKLHLEYVALPDGELRMFLFTVPSDFLDSSFRIAARFEHPSLGQIDCANFPSIDVVAPKTKADSNIVWDSMILYTGYSNDDNRIVNLADSLVAFGYTGSRGLIHAQNAAERLEQWDVALKLFDFNFQCNQEAALQFRRDGMSPDEVLVEYSVTRTRLLAKQPETRRRTPKY